MTTDHSLVHLDIMIFVHFAVRLLKVYTTLSLNTIHLNVFVYKACKYHSVAEYFISLLICSVLIKSRIVKESFLVCAQIVLTWIVKAYVEAYSHNAITICDVEKHFEQTSWCECD